jgi:hypothetical protein
MVAAMLIIETVDHTAAIAAAKTAFDVVQKATWPTEIAKPAKQCARDMLVSITESLAHGSVSASRRRCLRNARAHGLGSDDSLPLASKALSMIGMTYHATSMAVE